MLTKVTPPAISDAEPFANDLHDRKTVAEHLTALCKNARTPFVIAIDGKWGTGKTTFLEMWGKHLHKEGFVCLSYNAWESDFASDPGTVFMGEIQAAIKSKRIDLSARPEAMKAWEATKQIGSRVLSRALPLAIKLLTHGIIDADAIKKISHAPGLTDDEVASWAQGVATDEIDRHALARHELKEFRKQLEGFAGAVSQTVPGSTEKFPLIFMIDELDRCRPTFAVELLERLKHIFCGEGILFVLGVDTIALGHSIRAVYGADYDAPDYLRRFFDFRLELAPPKPKELAISMYERLQFGKLLAGRNMSDHDAKMGIDFFARFSNRYHYSIRTTEQVFSELYTLFAMMPGAFKVCFAEVMALTCVKHGDSVLFTRLMNAAVSANDLIETISKRDPSNTVFEGRYGAQLRTLLFTMIASAPELDAEKARVRNQADTKSLIGVSEAVRSYAQQQVQAYELWEREELRGSLGTYIKNRLLLLQKFN